MLDNLILNQQSIETIYQTVSEFHQKFLKELGVTLPKLYNTKKEFTKDVLVYLTYNYPNTRVVSKEELTKFIRIFYPNVNDVQQARHLGAQKGWWIVAGGRDNIVLSLKIGEYQLYTLEKPYPSFKNGHRISQTEDWEEIKSQYQFRCATCGSSENQPNFNWPQTKTQLQKAHMNPNLSLIAGNTIPQCQKCNRGDRNRWVYDEKGRVVKIANPNVITACDLEIQKQVYKILFDKFKGKNPANI
jgi:hypothetical protein